MRASEPASFWQKNVVAVVIFRHRVSENVVVAETSYQRLDQAPVVQTLNNGIERINHYPVDKY